MSPAVQWFEAAIMQMNFTRCLANPRLVIRMARSALVAVLACMLLASGAHGQTDNSVAVEALLRLKDIDLESNPALKAKVLKVLESTRGTTQFIHLVDQFKLQDQETGLL